MPGTWFGRSIAPHADFEVLDCGTLRLPQTNASLVVYLPPRRHPPTCQVLLVIQLHTLPDVHCFNMISCTADCSYSKAFTCIFFRRHGTS